MKSGASEPQTAKNRKEEEGFALAGSIFSAQPAWCLWVGKWHHFLRWTVGELN